MIIVISWEVYLITVNQKNVPNKITSLIYVIYIDLSFSRFLKQIF